MSQYRRRLPQLEGGMWITDGGLETTLIFHKGIDLPQFAAFQVLKDENGLDVMRDYYAPYAEIARDSGFGFLLETPTWRASADWGAKLGYDEAALADANRKSVKLLLELRRQHESARTPVVVCGAVGPRGDGYSVTARMSAGQARDYHARQIGVLADAGADMIAAWTLNYADEAIGVALAARAAGIPAAVSFTVETDGRLPSSETLPDAIARTEDATGGFPAYYLINCAHPTHFRHVLETDGGWRARVKGIRANASKRSHAELDGSADLDMGDPQALGAEYRELRTLLPQLSIAGGCCGTDHRHVAAIAQALSAQA